MINVAIWICIIVGFIMIIGYLCRFLMTTVEICKRIVNSFKNRKARKAKVVKKKKVDRKGLKVIDCK